jgi:deazaflavin-dependent oxidoreductase (nitroreductase family)
VRTLLPKNVEIALGLRLLGLLQVVYERTDGRVGSRLGRYKLLLLRTRGRKSGRLRTAELLYVEDGDRLVVIGSKGGSDSPPAWLLNLQADPHAQVQVGTRRFGVEARIATGAERRRLWQKVNAVWPDYQRYQDRSSRQIPVVVLEPAPSATRLTRSRERVHLAAGARSGCPSTAATSSRTAPIVEPSSFEK